MTAELDNFYSDENPFGRYESECSYHRRELIKYEPHEGRHLMIGIYNDLITKTKMMNLLNNPNKSPRQGQRQRQEQAKNLNSEFYNSHVEKQIKDNEDNPLRAISDGKPNSKL